jgi:hypothetical protein
MLRAAAAFGLATLLAGITACGLTGSKSAEPVIPPRRDSAIQIDESVVPPRRSARPVRRAADARQLGEVTVWIDWAANESIITDPVERAALFRQLLDNGVTGIGLETIDEVGTRRFLGRIGQREYAEIMASARRAGLQVTLLYKPFAAPIDADILSYSVSMLEDSTTTATTTRSEPSALNEFAEWSPVVGEVQDTTVREMRALASFAPDAILLIDFGFESSLADVSLAAKRSFEFASRRSLRAWPDDVRPGSPLHAAWMVWRAETLRDLLARVRSETFPSAVADHPMLGALVPGPYEAHYDRGLNWATPYAESDATATGQPPGYFATAAGESLDFIVLGTWLAALTEDDAAAAGYRADAAAEPIVRKAPIKDRPKWTTLMVSGTENWDDLRNAIRARQELSDGVLVLSLSSLKDAGLDTATTPLISE